MCGIAGAVETARSSTREQLTARGEVMAATLAHRGPDDAGVWTAPEQGVVLAHRRLAIIDLTAGGHQPMCSHDDRYVLVFNGEIYNYADLRRDLLAAGVQFRSDSDTEVLLEAIAAHGLDEALRRARGMFALGLYDRHTRKLSLARDRLGEKPLYYGWAGRTFVFGSECRALRAHPDVEPTVDRASLAALLRYSYVPGPHSAYEGIFKLTPGTVLELDLDAPAATPVPRPYWSLRQVAETGRRHLRGGTPEQAVEALDVLLRDAVASCMVSDVPLGAFLSGGTDSSTVVALMQQQSDRPVRTYTVGFAEEAFDESPYARAVAEHLGTEHTELHVSPTTALEVIPELPSMYDEPFADSSQVPTALVSRLARRDVSVALSGDGGDELFSGYGRYFAHRDRWRRLAPVPKAGRRAAARVARAVPVQLWDRAVSPLARRAGGRLSHPGDTVHNAALMVASDGPEELYRTLLSHDHDPTALVLGATERSDVLTDSERWASVNDPLDHLMYVDGMHYLPDAILAKVDRAAMATSLETRVPLLDHRVVEFAWTLPAPLRVHGTQGKWLLRQVLDRYVPSALVDRPKMGFGVPVGPWLRGPLRPWAEALLAEDRLRDQGLLNVTGVRRLWAEHLDGRPHRQDQLWSLLMFQAWHDRWMVSSN